MNVVFMGTPEFAVPTLQELIFSNHKVVAVFTQRPKPRDRGLKEAESPVHILANQHNIPVYTPSSVKTEEALHIITNIEADIIVVAAYGFIIPASILYCKKYGAINLHPSSLPRFRGAAPLQHTIIEGDGESSICVIQMDEGMDTGDILLQQDFSLPHRADVKWLHDYCASEGAKLVVQVLDNREVITPRKQPGEGIKYAGKLSKIDGLIDFDEDAFKIDCKIRGMVIWPGCYFNSNLGEIKIIEAEPLMLNHQEIPGKILDKKNLIISCKSGAIQINKLQIPGKKQIATAEFVNGYKDFEVIPDPRLN